MQDMGLVEGVIARLLLSLSLPAPILACPIPLLFLDFMYSNLGRILYSVSVVVVSTHTVD